MTGEQQASGASHTCASDCVSAFVCECMYTSMCGFVSAAQAGRNAAGKVCVCVCAACPAVLAVAAADIAESYCAECVGVFVCACVHS